MDNAVGFDYTKPYEGSITMQCDCDPPKVPLAELTGGAFDIGGHLFRIERTEYNPDTRTLTFHTTVIPPTEQEHG